MGECGEVAEYMFEWIETDDDLEHDGERHIPCTLIEGKRGDTCEDIVQNSGVTGAWTDWGANDTGGVEDK